MSQGQGSNLTNQMYKNSSVFVFCNQFNLALKLSFLQMAEINVLSNSLFHGGKKGGGAEFKIEILYGSQFSAFSGSSCFPFPKMVPEWWGGLWVLMEQAQAVFLYRPLLFTAEVWLPLVFRHQPLPTLGMSAAGVIYSLSLRMGSLWWQLPGSEAICPREDSNQGQCQRRAIFRTEPSPFKGAPPYQAPKQLKVNKNSVYILSLML